MSDNERYRRFALARIQSWWVAAVLVVGSSVSQYLHAASIDDGDVSATSETIVKRPASTAWDFSRRLSINENLPALQLQLTGPEGQYNQLQNEDRQSPGYVIVTILSGGGLNQNSDLVPGDLTFVLPGSTVEMRSSELEVESRDTMTETPDVAEPPAVLSDANRMTMIQPTAETTGDAPLFERMPLTYRYGRIERPSRYQETLEFSFGEAIRAGTEIQLRYVSVPLPETAADVDYGLAYRLQQDATWRPLPPQRISVVPTSPSTLNLEAPVDIVAGVPFDVRLSIVDDFGNLSGNTVPALQLLMNGRFVRTLERMATNPVVVSDLRFDTSGPARIEVRSSGGQWRSMSERVVTAAQVSGHQTRWVRLNESTGEFATGDQHQGDPSMLGDFEADLEGRGLYASQERGGHRLVLTDDQTVFEVQAVEVPADPRQMPSNGGLAAIISPSGSHLWRLRQLADRGHRFGIVGGWQRPDLPRLMNPLTGVLVRPGEALTDGFAQGRTWVTSGPRIDLRFSVNGTDLGGRAPFSEQRTIRGHIRATAPLLEVSLYRNGELLRPLDGAHEQKTRPVDQDETVRSADSDTLLLQFNSDSSPAQPLWDAPRNGREWLGYVVLGAGKINRARLVGPGGRVGAIEISDSGERVDFITWTRGTAAGMLVEVEELPVDTDITLVLSPGWEDATSKAVMRPPAQTPGGQFRFRLSGPGGEQRRDVRVDGYTDSIALRWLREQPGDRDRQRMFELTDFRPRGFGDYYYLVAHQVDGHVAVSSPVWVGGFD
ncbi:MAG: hypothetical protein AAF525_18420 [Pseudomonadota bacterium]